MEGRSEKDVEPFVLEGVPRLRSDQRNPKVAGSMQSGLTGTATAPANWLSRPGEPSLPTEVGLECTRSYLPQRSDARPEPTPASPRSEDPG